MTRISHVRIFVLAVLLALILPGFAQAKRFKRYPGDVQPKPAEAAPASPAPDAQGPEAEEEPAAEEEDEDQEPEEAPGLLGSALHGQGGVTVEYIYTGDVFNNMRGGINTRNATEYLGLFDLALTADLDHYCLSPGGTVFMLAESFHGLGISGNHVGDFQNLDNIDSGRENFQMSEFWWERGFLDDLIRVRLGKQDANAEFGVVDLGGDFVNASFGMIPNVPMPAWPDQAMGVVTFFRLTEWLDFNVGVFDGASDGRSWGFSNTGAVFSIYEFKSQWSLACGQLPGDFHVGLWYHSDVVEDLANANITHEGNHGVYMGFDQLIWKECCDEEDDQGLGAFLQYGWAPDECNEVSDYFGAGLVYKGLVPCRDDDVTGAGVARAMFSDRLGVPSDETTIEVFHKIPLTPYITIQPDMQYICNPSGVEQDAFVAGLRFEAVL
jgi:porin